MEQTQNEKSKNLFDGCNYITARVMIPADDFARQMLGDNPEPWKIEEFIRENASLMEILYGTARIVEPMEVTDNERVLRDIQRRVSFIDFRVDELAKRAALLSVDHTPWWRRILRRFRKRA